MATGAIAGVGTIFQRWDGTVWVTIADINAIVGPSAKRDNIDVTSVDTEEGYREFIAGFKDGDEVALNMSFTRDTFELMVSDFLDDDYQYYQILFPDVDETVIAFEGFVSKLPLELESGDKIKANISIKVTGQLEESANPTYYDVLKGIGTLEGSTSEIYAMVNAIRAATTPTESVSYAYQEDLDPTKDYITAHWADGNDNEFDLHIPLLVKYGFASTFANPIYPITDDWLNQGNKNDLAMIEKCGCELGQHSIMNHLSMFVCHPLYDGRTTPSNDDMRVERSDGTNEFGELVTTTLDASIGGAAQRAAWIGTVSATTGATAWQDMTDQDCEDIRKSLSFFGRPFGLTAGYRVLEAFDYLSNRYCGTTGYSVLDGDYTTRAPNVLDPSSEPSESNRIQGGIFQGAATTCNHEVWERGMVIVEAYMKEVCGKLTDLKYASTAGGITKLAYEIENQRLDRYGRFQDREHTKIQSGSSTHQSSITNKTRSWTGVLRDFGITVTMNTNGEAGYGGFASDLLPRLEAQRIMKKNGHKKLDIVGDGYYYDFRIWNPNLSDEMQSFLLASEDLVKELYDYTATDSYYINQDWYDMPPAFSNLINQITKYNAWGLIPSSSDDSATKGLGNSSYILHLEALYQFCKRAGIQAITKEAAEYMCANMPLPSGYNYFPNNTFKTTPKTITNSTNAPAFPDGWNGGVIIQEDTGSGTVNVLHISIAGTFFTRQYAIKPAIFNLSFKANGVATLYIEKILNNVPMNPYVDSGTGYTVINTISINSPSEYTLYEDTVTIPDVPLESYDPPATPSDQVYQDYFQGYGLKICGIQIRVVITGGNFVKIGNCSLIET